MLREGEQDRKRWKVVFVAILSVDVAGIEDSRTHDRRRESSACENIGGTEHVCQSRQSTSISKA